ncbi:hypothetical protein NEHOM01_1469 [Nematocida homosporus]|uniref:uncharacterized protein n=1 Tax=Nematocida homosporus TaxID=1912981 RepID=UPI002220B996|nr:uncharacterized protein NEHOM01_1469 [Nematocida homosporus]KAI5186436.1 hypothetical protein NEHOM01_1469 [Nematocida homosporus]
MRRLFIVLAMLSWEVLCKRVLRSVRSSGLYLTTDGIGLRLGPLANGESVRVYNRKIYFEHNGSFYTIGVEADGGKAFVRKERLPSHERRAPNYTEHYIKEYDNPGNTDNNWPPGLNFGPPPIERVYNKTSIYDKPRAHTHIRPSKEIHDLESDDFVGSDPFDVVFVEEGRGMLHFERAGNGNCLKEVDSKFYFENCSKNEKAIARFFMETVDGSPSISSDPPRNDRDDYYSKPPLGNGPIPARPDGLQQDPYYQDQYPFPGSPPMDPYNRGFIPPPRPRSRRGQGPERPPIQFGDMNMPSFNPYPGRPPYPPPDQFKPNYPMDMPGHPPDPRHMPPRRDHRPGAQPPDLLDFDDMAPRHPPQRRPRRRPMRHSPPPRDYYPPTSPPSYSDKPHTNKPHSFGLDDLNEFSDQDLKIDQDLPYHNRIQKKLGQLGKMISSSSSLLNIPTAPIIEHTTRTTKKQSLDHEEQEILDKLMQTTGDKEVITKTKIRRRQKRPLDDDDSDSRQDEEIHYRRNSRSKTKPKDSIPSLLTKRAKLRPKSKHSPDREIDSDKETDWSSSSDEARHNRKNKNKTKKQYSPSSFRESHSDDSSSDIKAPPKPKIKDILYGHSRHSRDPADLHPVLDRIHTKHIKNRSERDLLYPPRHSIGSSSSFRPSTPPPTTSLHQSPPPFLLPPPPPSPTLSLPTPPVVAPAIPSSAQTVYHALTSPVINTSRQLQPSPAHTPPSTFSPTDQLLSATISNSVPPPTTIISSSPPSQPVLLSTTTPSPPSNAVSNILDNVMNTIGSQNSFSSFLTQSANLTTPSKNNLTSSSPSKSLATPAAKSISSPTSLSSSLASPTVGKPYFSGLPLPNALPTPQPTSLVSTPSLPNSSTGLNSLNSLNGLTGLNGLSNLSLNTLSNTSNLTAPNPSLTSILNGNNPTTPTNSPSTLPTTTTTTAISSLPTQTSLTTSTLPQPPQPSPTTTTVSTSSTPNTSTSFNTTSSSTSNPLTNLTNNLTGGFNFFSGLNTPYMNSNLTQNQDSISAHSTNNSNNSNNSTQFNTNSNNDSKSLPSTQSTQSTQSPDNSSSGFDLASMLNQFVNYNSSTPEEKPTSTSKSTPKPKPSPSNLTQSNLTQSNLTQSDPFSDLFKFPSTTTNSTPSNTNPTQKQLPQPHLNQQPSQTTTNSNSKSKSTTKPTPQTPTELLQSTLTSYLSPESAEKYPAGYNTLLKYLL